MNAPVFKYKTFKLKSSEQTVLLLWILKGYKVYVSQNTVEAEITVA